ncbi:T9SS type A sorting domain-containing protein [Flavobacterium soli]|uniref:T9SS type A sorting domain-containing protein n=1 Tax=Flavobacterium soli TaxID=344881 RepID=UPI0003FD4170|nr:T9SS type A sorting domain-containing protein [Flavobacterium soli]
MIKRITLLFFTTFNIVNAQQAKLYYVDYNTTIHSLSLSGTNENIIKTSLKTPAGVSFYNNKLYASDVNLTNRNYRFEPDGSQTEIVHDGLDGLVSPTSVAGYNNQLYFLDQEFIRKSDIDGNNIEILISNISSTSSKIVVANNKLYWVDSQTINCANLDGTNHQVLTDEGSDFRGLFIDGGYIYWSVNNAGARVIKRAPLDFSSETVLISSAVSPSGLSILNDLTVFENKIYWTDTGLDKIMRSNLDGTNIQTVYTISGLANPKGITANNGYVYWSDTYIQNNKIHRVSTNSTNYQVIVGNEFSSVSTIAISSEEMFLSANYLKKLDLTSSVFFTLSSNVGGIINDLEATKFDEIYFLMNNSTISKSSTNNYNPSTIINASSDDFTINSFAINGDFIYWIENGLNTTVGKIYRATLSGENTTLVYTANSLLTNLNVKYDNLYWSSLNTISNSDLTGENVQIIHTSNEGDVSSFAIYCNKIYYSLTRYNFTYGLISIEIDGTNSQLIKNTPTALNSLMVYDPQNIQVVCENRQVLPNGSNQYILPDYTDDFLLLNVNCLNDISITQNPEPGSVITEDTSVLLTVLDQQGFQITECQFNATLSNLSLDQNNSIKEFAISPNPSTDKITIVAEFEFETVNLYDMFGKKTKTITTNGSKSCTLNIDSAPNGVYVVEVIGFETVSRKKMIKN